MAACRSCGAQIRWAVTDKGKRIPLDWEPDAEGNVLLVLDETALEMVALVDRKDRPIAGLAGQRYFSHFKTCPDAAQHRRHT